MNPEAKGSIPFRPASTKELLAGHRVRILNSIINSVSIHRLGTMIAIVSGDLIKSADKYIAHQCNCITTHSAGCAARVFSAFPWANIYSERKTSPRVDMGRAGQVVIRGDGLEHRFVINMLAQVYPGRPKYPDSSLDGRDARLGYFRSCLTVMAKIPDIESIGFPYRIGCNLAGGNWPHYLGMLEEFSTWIDAPVRIYRHGENK